jgi:hypothetical protein
MKVMPTYEMLAAQVALLKECHDAADQALRSAMSIAERDGKNTNWSGHRAQLRAALDYYHEANSAFNAAARS